MSNSSTPRPSDRWIPWYFVAFFVTLISVLVPMGIIAVRTHTGVVTDNAYQKGLAYNQAIEANEQQNALNWHHELSVAFTQEKTLQADFYLTDANHQPIKGAEVNFWLVRPTQSGQDQHTVLTDTEDGHYKSTLPIALHGLWEARVSANLQGHNYQASKRVVLP